MPKYFSMSDILRFVNKDRSQGRQLADEQALVDTIYQGIPQWVEAQPRITANHLTGIINSIINNNDLLVSVARLISSRTNEALVSIINSHNPYTSNNPNDMSMFVGNPDLSNTSGNDINQMEIEVDGPYTTPKEWYFKSLPQQINKALRIKYRYRAVNLQVPGIPQLDPHHWVTAYLLIGFEDGGI